MSDSTTDNTSIDSIMEVHTAAHKPLVLTPELCLQLLSRIESIIMDTCIDCNYDQQNIKATNWQYILHQIALKVFSVHPELVREFNVSRQTYSFGRLIIDNMELIYNYIYSPLCDKYNQIKSEYSFCGMLSVANYNLFKEWERRGKVTSENVVFRQKMISEREASLRNAMLSSGSNPVKFLAIGNHEFAWNESREQKIDDAKPVLTLEELPALAQLELTDNSNEQILNCESDE